MLTCFRMNVGYLRAPRLRPLVPFVRATCRWRGVWSIGGMILTGKKQSAPRTTCTNVPLKLGSNQGLHYESPAIERLSHDTVLIHVSNTNRTYSFSFYSTADTLCFHYIGQAMEAVYGNRRYWLLESYRTHICCVVVWAKCRVLMLRPELYIVASELYRLSTSNFHEVLWTKLFSPSKSLYLRLCNEHRRVFCETCLLRCLLTYVRTY